MLPKKSGTPFTSSGKSPLPPEPQSFEAGPDLNRSSIRTDQRLEKEDVLMPCVNALDLRVPGQGVVSETTP
jgi:hypothetical protein